MYNDIHLTGVFQNIETAIVEAISSLSRYSEYRDGSVRCKEIYNLLRQTQIMIDGKLQVGNLRFTLFSSALCGRRVSLKLFEKITDPNRHGSWWRLKVPYREAMEIALQQKTRYSPFYADINDITPRVSNFPITRSEALRRKFLLAVPFMLQK